MANLEIAPGKLEGNNAKNMSDLPDEILGHILSFMETREAVRTSTLSKRWKYVRTFTPSLVFDDRPFWEINQENLWIRVGDYVAREIHLRGLVKSFGFEVRHYIIDAAVLRSLITQLVMRNVEEVSLLLNASDDEHNVLPECLFTCKSLVHLKFSIGCFTSFQLPSTVRLSNLKTMSLSHVEFLDEHSTNQLFSSCPVLEDLTLEDCRWSNLKLINICTPKLLRLTISEGDYYGSTNPDGCRIVVFGPNLTEFDYEGDFFNEHDLDSAKSLERACIRQTDVTRRDRLYRLLPCLSSVKDLDLELDVNDNEVARDAEGLLDHMPIFKNLLRLEIHAYYDGSPVLDYDIGLIKKLLNNSPRLQVLKASWAVSLEHQILKLPKVSKHCKVIVDC